MSVGTGNYSVLQQNEGIRGGEVNESKLLPALSRHQLIGLKRRVGGCVTYEGTGVKAESNLSSGVEVRDELLSLRNPTHKASTNC